MSLWCHDKETLSALLALCGGIHKWLVDSFHKRPAMQTPYVLFFVSLNSCWTVQLPVIWYAQTLIKHHCNISWVDNWNRWVVSEIATWSGLPILIGMLFMRAFSTLLEICVEKMPVRQLLHTEFNNVDTCWVSWCKINSSSIILWCKISSSSIVLWCKISSWTDMICWLMEWDTIPLIRCSSIVKTVLMGICIYI